MQQTVGSDSIRPMAAATGAWSIVASPNLGDPPQNQLAAVACVSASDCWAVGRHFAGGPEQPLIERWNGMSWAVVASPNVGTTPPSPLTGAFTGLACVSASDCSAVGYYFTATSIQSLVVHWDGTSWAIVSSPNTSPTEFNVLNDVTCLSASDCWAVGYYSHGIALIQHWNGSSWSIVTNGVPELGNVLYDVTCASPSDCWAVGTSSTSLILGTGQSLIEQWDGTSWSVVTSPPIVGASNSFLNGVTCVSASDCWAVGNSTSVGGTTGRRTLVEHWDGTSWSIVSSPNTDTTQNNSLFGVTCVSGSDCWAVGNYDNRGRAQTLIQRWDANSWEIVSSPNTSTMKQNLLVDVTCASASDCWAVGNDLDGSVSRTLTMRYTAGLPTSPSVVSRQTHGAAGPFDIYLPLLGTAGIECRTGGIGGAYQVVFLFSLAVSANNAVVTPAAGETAEVDGPPTSSADGREVTVKLKNVGDAQTLTVTLTDVSYGTTTGDVSVQMALLVGDTTGDGLVNSGDAQQTRNHSGQLTESTNFRSDVNLDAAINSGDAFIVRKNAGTGLHP